MRRVLEVGRGSYLEQLRHGEPRKAFLQEAVDDAGVVDSPYHGGHDGHNANGEDEDNEGGGCEALNHGGFHS